MIFANQYLATVRDESQQIAKRLVSAKSSKHAVLLLNKQKYRVLSIESRPNPFWEALKNGRLEFTSPASKRDLSTFSNNLALMV